MRGRGPRFVGSLSRLTVLKKGFTMAIERFVDGMMNLLVIGLSLYFAIAYVLSEARWRTKNGGIPGGVGEDWWRMRSMNDEPESARGESGRRGGDQKDGVAS